MDHSSQSLQRYSLRLSRRRALAALAHPSHIVNYAVGDVLACRLPATRNPLGRFFYISLSRFERGQG
ncbi:hypothetical protein DK749_12945 [Salmonella enterica subsp. salamae]|nr:hypothetical protein [Salmonella enterica subsp. enterica]ECE5743646.1 hypothetical protein [Salmonella enterica subsp. salamae]ECJ3937548.1 hypothetical protein [Salmonella enterica subsp. salamae]